MFSRLSCDSQMSTCVFQSISFSYFLEQNFLQKMYLLHFPKPFKFQLRLSSPAFSSFKTKGEEEREVESESNESKGALSHFPRLVNQWREKRGKRSEAPKADGGEALTITTTAVATAYNVLFLLPLLLPLRHFYYCTEQ